MRVGGELYKAGVDTPAAFQGQLIFLTAVREQVPAVLAMLEDPVLPAYSSYVASGAGDVDLDGSDPAPPHVRDLLVALVQWANRWSLWDEWAIRSALLTLENWRAGGKRGRWYPRMYQRLPTTTLQFDFVAKDIDLENFSRSDVEARLRSDFEDRMREALDRYVDYKRTDGWKSVPVKRARRTTDEEPSPAADLWRGYEALALFQCAKQPLRTVARHLGITEEKNVTPALKRFAAEINLTRRSVLPPQAERLVRLFTLLNAFRPESVATPTPYLTVDDA